MQKLPDRFLCVHFVPVDGRESYPLLRIHPRNFPANREDLMGGKQETKQRNARELHVLHQSFAFIPRHERKYIHIPKGSSINL